MNDAPLSKSRASGWGRDMHDQTNPLLGTETDTRAPLPSPRGCFELGLAVAPRPLTCAKSGVSLAPVDVDGWGEVPPPLVLADPIRSSAVCIERREYMSDISAGCMIECKGAKTWVQRGKQKGGGGEMQESRGQSGRGQAKFSVRGSAHCLWCQSRAYQSLCQMRSRLSRRTFPDEPAG